MEIIEYLLLPLLSAIMGLGAYFFPMKEINNFAGARTKISRKNKYVWDYAQKILGKNILTSSMIYVPIYLILLLILGATETSLLISAWIFVANIFYFAIKTEVDIRKYFNKDGRVKLENIHIEEVEKKDLEIRKIVTKEKINETDKGINRVNNVETKKILLEVKSLLEYILNFSTEDLDTLSEKLELLDDPKISKVFYEYTNESIIKKLNSLMEMNNKTKINIKNKVLRKKRG